MELFFTLGVVNSFTLSVDVLMCHSLEEFKNCVTQIVSHIFCYLVRPQNRLWLPSEPRFRFWCSFYRKSQFRFRF